MKREILFRRVYKDRQTGAIKTVEWGVFGDIFRSPASLSSHDVVCDEQYTGLRDKNGARIFEGDKYQHAETIRFVEYRNGNFSITTMGKTETMLLSFCQRSELGGKCYGEVIGNIHDEGGEA